MGVFESIAEIRAVARQLAARRVAPVAFGLAAYYGALCFSHAHFLPRDVSGTMTAIAGLTAVLMIAVFAASRATLVHGYPQTVTLLMASVVLGNTLAHLALTREIEQTGNVALAILAGGLLFFSGGLLAAFSLAAIIGWYLIVRNFGVSDLPHHAFQLAAAAFIGALAFWIRLRGIHDLEGMRVAHREAQLRVETQRQLRELENRVRHSEKLDSLGLLAGGVAHDLNNVLVSLIGNADLAKRLLPPGEPAVRHLDLVLDASRRAAHLARQMLEYSGKGRIAAEAIHLPNLIRNLKTVLQSSLPANVTLSFVLADAAPMIDGDSGQLGQVAVDLVTNAGEACAKDGGAVIVRVDVFTADEEALSQFAHGVVLPAGRYVRLAIHDNGRGIDKETLHRVFDPFFTTKSMGRGLGLASVSGIVRAHQGAIGIESEADQGTLVSVLFPIAARQEPAPRADVTVESVELH